VIELVSVKEEKGYSLLSVILVFAMISILGLSLLTLTINSMKFVTVNKSTIQDKASAEMGIEEAMAQIDNAVEKINKDIENRVLLVDNVLGRLSSSLGNIKSLGPYKYTISHETLKSGQNGVFLEKVVIKAPIGDTKRSITKTITVSTIAEVFKYGAVSPGDLYFNGASYIEGDVLVKDSLYNSYYGKFIYRYTTLVPTSYPAIKGYLTVGGKYYYYNPSWWRDYDSYIPTPQNLNVTFSVSPQIKERSLDVQSLPVNSYVSSKSGILTATKNNTYNNNLVIDRNTSISGNLVIKGDLIVKKGVKLSVSGSVYVGKDATLSGTLSVPNQDKYIYINGNANISELNLDGEMYIGGSVDIKNDLNTNGTLFVMGGATVEELSNNSGGTLILLCNETIKLANNNLYNDNPKIINAYLYSNQELEIYGIGSHMNIHGGIYGNPIILNASKGKTRQTPFSGSFNRGDLYFEGNQNQIDPTKSRLAIYYKKEMILNPPKGIPTVEKMQVKEIDVVYE
jgi:type II secretory pathway pseudopilin PulG/cytoskeletal protein CcmA (bactofilin family)